MTNVDQALEKEDFDGKSVYTRHHKSGEVVLRKAGDGVAGTVVIRDSKVTCAGTNSQCTVVRTEVMSALIVDLEGGFIAPGLLAYGAPLGMEENPCGNLDLPAVVWRCSPAIMSAFCVATKTSPFAALLKYSVLPPTTELVVEPNGSAKLNGVG